MNWNIEYFVNGDRGERNLARPVGHAILAPYSGAPIPPGYRREFANTIAEVDTLEKRLQRQVELDFEREALSEHQSMAKYREAVRERILEKMQGKGVDPSFQAYVRDYMREFLKLHENHPKRQYFQNQIECYIAVRHNNLDDRPLDRDRLDERMDKL